MSPSGCKGERKPFFPAPETLIKTAPPAPTNLQSKGYESLAADQLSFLSPGEQLIQRSTDSLATLTLTDRGLYVETSGQPRRFLSHMRFWGGAVLATESLTDLQLVSDRKENRWLLSGTAEERGVSARLLVAVSGLDGPAADWKVYSHDLNAGTVTGGLRVDTDSVRVDVGSGAEAATLQVEKREIYAAAAAPGFVRRARPETTVPTHITVGSQLSYSIVNTFAFNYSTPGSGSIVTQQALFNDHVDGAHACYVVWVGGLNQIGLASDDGRTFNFAQQADSVANSQCSVSVNFASAGSMSITILFTTSFSGQKGIYGYVQGTDGTDSGWELIGTTTIPAANAGAIPTSAEYTTSSPSVFSFNFEFTDQGGADQIRGAQMLFNDSIDGLNACYLVYDGPSQRLGLVSDDGSSISYIASGSGAAGNSQCQISGATFSIERPGPMLLLINAVITFLPHFSGARYLYMLGQDSYQNSNWFTQTVILVPGTAQPPQIKYSTADSGSGISRAFEVNYAIDPSSSSVDQVQLLINSGISGVGACYVIYDVPTRMFTLVDDSGTGGSQIAARANSSVSNSQCVLSGSGSGDDYSGGIAFLIQFTSAYTGPKFVYGLASAQGLSSGWTLLGNWNVPATINPFFSSVTANSTVRGTVQINWSTLSEVYPLSVQFIVNPSLAGVNSCYVLVAPEAETISLTNDAGTASASATYVNQQVTLANTRCSATTGPNYYYIVNSGAVSVTLINPVVGQTYNVYAYVANSLGASGWQVVNSFTF